MSLASRITRLQQVFPDCPVTVVRGSRGWLAGLDLVRASPAADVS
jgi:hypothetical protein